MSVVEGMAASTIVAGALLLIGSPLLYRGIRHWARYRRFSETPIKTPATVSPGETALVTGIARANEHGTISTPLTAQPSLLAAWDIHSLRRYGILGTKRVWAPEVLGVDTNGFELHERDTTIGIPNWSRQERIQGKKRLQMTGTGQMPVEGLDVEGLWVETKEFETDAQIRPSEEMPEQYNRLSSRVDLPANEASTGILPPVLRFRTPEWTLRLRETSVQKGDQVTVFGRARASASDRPLRLVEPNDRPLLVSQLNPETLLQRYRRSYLKWVYGLVLIVLVFALVAGLAVAL